VWRWPLASSPVRMGLDQPANIVAEDLGQSLVDSSRVSVLLRDGPRLGLDHPRTSNHAHRSISLIVRARSPCPQGPALRSRQPRWVGGLAIRRAAAPRSRSMDGDVQVVRPVPGLYGTSGYRGGIVPACPPTRSGRAAGSIWKGSNRSRVSPGRRFTMSVKTRLRMSAGRPRDRRRRVDPRDVPGAERRPLLSGLQPSAFAAALDYRYRLTILLGCSSAAPVAVHAACPLYDGC